MNVVDWVPGRSGAGEDCVPDDGFGFGLAALGRRVDCLQVEEYLFCIPVEEAAEIYRVCCQLALSIIYSHPAPVLSLPHG